MFEKHFGWRKKCTQQQLKCETILMEFCHYNLLGTSSNLNNVTIRNMFYISYTNGFISEKIECKRTATKS